MKPASISLGIFSDPRDIKEMLKRKPGNQFSDLSFLPKAQGTVRPQLTSCLAPHPAEGSFKVTQHAA